MRFPGNSKHDKPATLIGWSLGGLYARELGKLLAPKLRQVITIATPFNGSADDISASWISSLLGGGAASIDPLWIERLRMPPPIRTTSIYSRSDGVVAWETCRPTRAPGWSEDIEVDGSHMGRLEPGGAEHRRGPTRPACRPLAPLRRPDLNAQPHRSMTTLNHSARTHEKD